MDGGWRGKMSRRKFLSLYRGHRFCLCCQDRYHNSWLKWLRYKEDCEEEVEDE